MKTLLLMAGCVVGITHMAFSQHVVAGPVGESTIAGVQVGASVSYLSKREFSLGVFFVKSASRSDAWSTPHVVFYGVHTAVPLMRTSKIVFSGTFRAGLSNQQFVVVVPGAETRLMTNRRVQLVSSVAWRYGHAALGAALLLKL
ncbi:hypothetical protein [Chryseolinea lacunae]|uniref:DUF3575 domain-containing protein n=1 Tax=Chryseolinea lacunae TaxID=2801331 RepID=A0ABS1L2R4_9BACT|nr:hypothetical protein [Chryseolinea lacunae]MBL0745823.1 hypothetical protein [Chryseolinea lacunae]